MDRPGGENPYGSGSLAEVTPALDFWQLPELTQSMVDFRF
jgi:hypothetical protein